MILTYFNHTVGLGPTATEAIARSGLGMDKKSVGVHCSSSSSVPAMRLKRSWRAARKVLRQTAMTTPVAAWSG